MDPAVLGRLIDEHAAALQLYAAQWCRCPEDVVQEAFVELVGQAEPPGRIVPWLYRVVRNRAASAARGESRRRRHESAAALEADDWFVPTEPEEGAERRLIDALAELPVAVREVVVARIWGRLGFEQIAELAGVSTSTAHRRYEAGLRTLRERWDAACANTGATKTTTDATSAVRRARPTESDSRPT